jgi:hypothetical protein
MNDGSKNGDFHIPGQRPSRRQVWVDAVVAQIFARVPRPARKRLTAVRPHISVGLDSYARFSGWRFPQSHRPLNSSTSLGSGNKVARGHSGSEDVHIPELAEDFAKLV